MSAISHVRDQKKCCHGTLYRTEFYGGGISVIDSGQAN
jgi:hypothetical protein